MSQAARLLNKFNKSKINESTSKPLRSRAALLMPRLTNINESFSVDELTKKLRESSGSVYRGETELKSDVDYLYLQNPTTKQRISQIRLVDGQFNMCG